MSTEPRFVLRMLPKNLCTVTYQEKQIIAAEVDVKKREPNCHVWS